MSDSFLLERMLPHIGRTVTIFTESGGLSGSGFTGILAAVCDKTVKLITDIGAPPACPIGSACVGGVCGYGNNVGYGGGYYGGGYGGGYGGSCGHSNNYGCGCNYGCGSGYGYGGGAGFGGGFSGGYNWLGSIAEIPLDKIVSFTHNAI